MHAEIYSISLFPMWICFRPFPSLLWPCQEDPRAWASEGRSMADIVQHLPLYLSTMHQPPAVHQPCTNHSQYAILWKWLRLWLLHLLLFYSFCMLCYLLCLAFVLYKDHQRWQNIRKTMNAQRMNLESKEWHINTINFLRSIKFAWMHLNALKHCKGMGIVWSCMVCSIPGITFHLSGFFSLEHAFYQCQGPGLRGESCLETKLKTY